jgi:DNA-binding GntR family transcriptional regulator
VFNDHLPDNLAAPAVTPVALEVPSLVDALYVELRERVLTGALPSGTGVTELELAAQYSVARPTAKAAMERLVHEGLLRRSSHKTARVPELGLEDIRDLYRTRTYLEREVVRSLAENRLVPDAARRAVLHMYEFRAESQFIEIVNVNVEFHSALVDALGSPRLSRLHRSLMAEVRLCMAQVRANYLLPPKTIADEHTSILAEIEHGDAQGAMSEITGYLDRACTRLTSHLEAISNTSN